LDQVCDDHAYMRAQAGIYAGTGVITCAHLQGERYTTLERLIGLSILELDYKKFSLG